MLGVDTGVNREECELNAIGAIDGKDGIKERAGEESAMRIVRMIGIFGGFFGSC